MTTGDGLNWNILNVIEHDWNMCLKMVVQTATREFLLPDIAGQKSARTSRPWETKTDQSMVQPVQHGQHGNALLCGSYGLQLVQLVQLVWWVLDGSWTGWALWAAQAENAMLQLPLWGKAVWSWNKHMLALALVWHRLVWCCLIAPHCTSFWSLLGCRKCSFSSLPLFLSPFVSIECRTMLRFAELSLW